MYFLLEEYSHFFAVSKIRPEAEIAIRQCLQELVEKKFVKIAGRWKQETVRTYAAKEPLSNRFRFHINYLPRFLEILANYGINDKLFEHVKYDLYEPKDANIKLHEHIQLYDYQEQSSQYVLAEDVSKMITIYTGGGKTITALKTAERIGKRTMILVLAKFKEKWVDDVAENLQEGSKVKVIKNRVDFINLIQNAVEDPDNAEQPDIIIMTLNLMQDYIREWTRHEGSEIDGMISPELIYSALGIGFRIIDEAHQSFHFVFKNDLYTHCPKCLYLTATLISSQPFMNAMYNLMWPKLKRDKSPPPPKYDEVKALIYYHKNPDYIRCEGASGYSHIMYEKAIFRHVPSKVQYLDMIGDAVENYFVPIYEKGKRMLIYCAMVETCEYVVHYLKDRFKDQKWKINRFTAGDPKTIIDTSDITVSTLGKSSTGFDVNGLVVVLMTVALSGENPNIQAKGRLRDLTKKPGFEHITPQFLYFVGYDIDKHRNYHIEKMRLFKERTTRHDEIWMPYTLGTYLPDYIEFKPKYFKGWKLKESDVKNPPVGQVKVRIKKFKFSKKK